MLQTLIPNLDEELDHLQALGPSGYVMAFNYSVHGPEYMRSGYPEKWQAEYEEKNYHMGDPVLMWALTNSGVRRWSDVKVPDIRGVMKRARTFGLKYGVAFSAKKGRKRSFLTVARADRELTDAEIAGLSVKFEVWCQLATNRAALTERELDVLRHLRDGMSQREIAEALGIVEATVKKRALSATAKLGAANRIQAVAMTLQRGYFD